jgi:hypothetical protein
MNPKFCDHVPTSFYPSFNHYSAVIFVFYCFRLPTPRHEVPCNNRSVLLSASCSLIIKSINNVGPRLCR